MIIKNNFNQNKTEYLAKEKEGLDKAISKLDKRFQNKEIDREKFLKQNEEFAKKQAFLKQKMEKLNRK